MTLLIEQFLEKKRYAKLCEIIKNFFEKKAQGWKIIIPESTIEHLNLML